MLLFTIIWKMCSKRGMIMKANKETIKKLEELLDDFEIEVNQAHEDGYLKPNTVNTYIIYANNFVRWCKGDFEPGGRNK